MDFSLSRELEMLRNMVREFAENELQPRESEFSEPEGEWPYDVWKRIAEDNSSVWYPNAEHGM